MWCLASFAKEAHRLAALHCGDFGQGERSSGTGRTLSRPDPAAFAAFILSASSHSRQSHVVGPDADPSLPDDVCARHVRRRRILLRLMSALEKRPSRTGRAEHTSGSERGDWYPHHEMFRNIVALTSVMAGLVPAIHVFSQTCNKDVDHRDKPGDDDLGCCSKGAQSLHDR